VQKRPGYRGRKMIGKYRPVLGTLEILENRDLPSAAPVITAPAATRAYVENAAATAVFSPATTVVDRDSPSLKGGRLTVAINVNPHSTDRLEIAPSSAPWSVTIKDGIVMRGTARVGTVSGGMNGLPLAVSFDGSAANPAAAQAILRQLTFRADTEDPSPLQRSVAAYIKDDTGKVSNAVSQKINVTAINDIPKMRDVGMRVVSAGVGPLSIPLTTLDPDASSLTYSYKVLNPSPSTPGSVSIAGTILTLTPSRDIRGSLTIQVSVTDGKASDSTTFRVDFNSTTQNGIAITRPILDRWLQADGVAGLGLPLATATRAADGTVTQKFARGTLTCSPDGEATMSDSISDTLVVPPSAGKGMESKTFARRPTLVVLTQGAAPSGYFLYSWQATLANNLATALIDAGSQTHVMLMHWDSIVSNGYGLGHAASAIWNWLSERINTCDVVFVGHSRGAIFNHELTDLVKSHPRIGTFYEVMIDPTAAIVMGDKYPKSVAANVDRAVVYDDGYPFLSPIYNGGVVADSMPVKGATYTRVSAPGVSALDSLTSHIAVADEYAKNWYKSDLERLLTLNPPLTGSVKYAAETFLDVYEYVFCPKGPKNTAGIVIKGGINKGNAYGSISVLGVGGAYVTIGRSGFTGDAGVAFLGNGSVSVTDKGFTTRVNAGGVASGGVVVTRDETKVDVSFMGVYANVGGKNAGLYFGGKKISVNVDQTLPKGSFVWNKTDADLSVRSEKFEKGNRVARDFRDKAGQYTKETWDNSGRYVKERGDAAAKSTIEVRNAAGKVLEQGAIEGGRWVNRQFNSGRVVAETIFQGGFGSLAEQAQTWDASGVRTSLQQFAANGQLTANAWLSGSSQWVSERWNGTGQRLSQVIKFGGVDSATFQSWSWKADGELSGFSEYTTSGVVAARESLGTSGRWVKQTFDGAGNVTRQWLSYGKYGSPLQGYSEWNAEKVATRWSDYAENGWKTFEAGYDSAGNWAETRYSGGVAATQRIWNNAGKYLGDKLQNFRDVGSGLNPSRWKLPW
jgi:hypothetical protein